MKPEEKSRQHINGQMLYEGWGLVKPGDYLPQYGAAVICEEVMSGHIRADYLFLLFGRPVGVCEAKRADIKLDTDEIKAQAESYTRAQAADLFPQPVGPRNWLRAAQAFYAAV